MGGAGYSCWALPKPWACACRGRPVSPGGLRASLVPRVVGQRPCRGARAFSRGTGNCEMKQGREWSVSLLPDVRSPLSHVVHVGVCVCQYLLGPPGFPAPLHRAGWQAEPVCSSALWPPLLSVDEATSQKQ